MADSRHNLRKCRCGCPYPWQVRDPQGFMLGQFRTWPEAVAFMHPAQRVVSREEIYNLLVAVGVDERQRDDVVICSAGTLTDVIMALLTPGTRVITTIRELNALASNVDVVTQDGTRHKAWQLQGTASTHRNLTEAFVLPATVLDENGGA